MVRRYDVPGIDGLNFVLEAALGGGGIASLRPDPQGNNNLIKKIHNYSFIQYFIYNNTGKAYGQILGDFTLKNMPNIEILKSKN